MKKIILVFILLVIVLKVSSQNYNDGRVAIIFGLQNENTIKTELVSNPVLQVPSYDYKNIPTDATLDSLKNNGRYVISITTTKFGTFIIHEDNTKKIEQMFMKIPGYAIKKECEKHFKKGWALQYYNAERDYAIFYKNPLITKQTFVKLETWKKNFSSKMQKWNSQGLYLLVTGYCDGVLQNGRTDSLSQQAFTISCYENDDKLVNKISSMAAEGWFVSSMGKYYSKYGNSDTFTVVFDSGQANKSKQVAIIEFKEEMDSVVSVLNDGYKIEKMFCGWENRNFQKEKEMADSYKADWLGILGGIVSSVSSLAGGNSSSSSDYTTDSGSSGYSGNSSSNSSTSKSSKVNHANWRSLDNSYNGYESQLIRISNSSNIDKQEVKRIQGKMKEIRKKIYEQSGHNRAVSQWENWNP